MLVRIGILVGGLPSSMQALWISVVIMRYDRMKTNYLVIHVVIIYRTNRDGNSFDCLQFCVWSLVTRDLGSIGAI